MARPLGVDFFIGLPESEEGRVAEIIPTEARPPLPDALPAVRAARQEIEAVFGRFDTRAWRAAEIPAGNGQGNACAFARIYGALARGGEIDGVRLLSEKGVERASAVRCERVDLVDGVFVRWAAGFRRNVVPARSPGDESADLPFWDLYGPNERAFGHTGAGGSYGFADPDRRIGVGYVMNRMHVNVGGDPRALRLVGAVYDCL